MTILTSRLPFRGGPGWGGVSRHRRGGGACGVFSSPFCSACRPFCRLFCVLCGGLPCSLRNRHSNRRLHRPLPGGIIGGVICAVMQRFVVGFACLFDGFVVAARRGGHDIAGAQRHYYRRRCYDYGCRKCGDEVGNVKVDAVSSGIY